MREIKFRAWVETYDGKEMIENYCYLGDENHFYAVDLTNERADIGMVIEVMQFTGLLDKNNKDIYEGDILQHFHDKRLFNWLVVFENGCFGIKNIGVDGYMGELYTAKSMYYFNDRIIIGNMYSNPELLKP